MSCDTEKSRTFRFEYAATIRGFPQDAKRARIWIPLPQSDEAQEVSELRVEGIEDAARHEIGDESAHGNRMLHVEYTAPFPREARITVSCDVTRREVREVAHLRGAGAGGRLLEGDRVAELNAEVKRRAAEAASGVRGTRAKARAIYDRVLADVAYDKSVPGWGHGNLDYVCSTGKGNCSDFHALFIGMARAEGIPAILEVGFPLPSDRVEGTVGGYHCWAWYLDGDVWRPVDASEADKAPERAGYFFGALCENRVGFTRGRDLVLDPPQAGEPLNFFIYPYVEVDGAPAALEVDRSFRFKDSA
jgi:transglutaminase-like putative cysteine protease